MGQAVKKDEIFEEDIDDENVGQLTLASAQECTDFFKKDSTSTEISREDEIDISDDGLDASGLELDRENEFLKEAIKNNKPVTGPRLTKSEDDLDIDRENEHLKNIQDTKTSGSIRAVGGKKIIEETIFESVKKYESLVDEIAKDPLFTNKGDLYPQINGNYFLLDHLIDGGMAKICRARYLADSATDGADKLVVLKMVQEKFSNDPEYATMFLDEIKVSFGLQHPNISTTFDYGKIGNNLFVSMEYIHGKDLKLLVDKLAAKKQVLPFEITLYIISKMCEGLFYAHNFSDQLTGQNYNIVHRDISPHNVMVSYDGYVKVIDFGIAKADTNEQVEQEGTVKGKINYFAPEYLEGLSIDHRYDQFAIGLTFWELLTGKKTFDEKDQMKTIKAIFDCNPRKPSLLNSQIPIEIEKIVMKTLSRNPADRYSDLSELNREVTSLIHKIAPGLNQQDLSQFMKQMWKEDFEKDLKTFLTFGEYKIDEIKSKINEYKKYQEKLLNQEDSKGNIVNLDLGFTALETSLIDKTQTKSEKTKKSKKKKDNLQKALMGMVQLASREEAKVAKTDKLTDHSSESVKVKNNEKIILIVAAILFVAIYKRGLILNYLTKAEVKTSLPVVEKTAPNNEPKNIEKKELRLIEAVVLADPTINPEEPVAPPIQTIKFDLTQSLSISNLESQDVYMTAILMNGTAQIPEVRQIDNLSEDKSEIDEQIEKQKLIEEMKKKLIIKEKKFEEAIENESNPIMNWLSKRKIYKLFFN